MIVQCYIAGEYYLPLYFQSALEASPVKSGALVLPITVTEASKNFLNFAEYFSTTELF
jgi:hypothetical protein